MNISYTSQNGSVYAYDLTMHLKSLWIDSTTGTPEKDQSIDIDFNYKFIPVEKSDVHTTFLCRFFCENLQVLYELLNFGATDSVEKLMIQDIDGF